MEEWKEVEREGITMGDILEAFCFLPLLQTLASLFRSKNFQNPNPASFSSFYPVNLVQTGLKRRFDFPRKSQRTCGKVNARAEKSTHVRKKSTHVREKSTLPNSVFLLILCSDDV
ncbi:unnamed protein product [Camellia sinensis]